MGYSCTKAASDTLHDVLAIACEHDGCSNTWRDAKGVGHFFERGRENADGAVTGRVHRFVGDTQARPIGSVRIDPDGTVKRWPGMPAAIIAKAIVERGRIRTRNGGTAF